MNELQNVDVVGVELMTNIPDTNSCLHYNARRIIASYSA
jgi:hypothetical protein